MYGNKREIAKKSRKNLPFILYSRVLLLRVFKETFWAVVMHPFLAHLLTNGFELQNDPIFHYAPAKVKWLLARSKLKLVFIVM